jgi:hypothetical protein
MSLARRERERTPDVPCNLWVNQYERPLTFKPRDASQFLFPAGFGRHLRAAHPQPWSK